MDHSTELEILKDFKNGLTRTEICTKYNINRHLVYRIIDRNGREKIIPNKKYHVNDKYFSQIDTEDKAYWLGFLYADGYVNDKQGEKSIELGLSRIDREHVELFSKYLNSNHPIKDKKGIQYLSSNIRIYNSNIVNDLIKHGCFNNKSWIIKYPTFINEHLQSHFIRGYFDGDGSIRKRGPNQYEVNIAGNQAFILGLKKILEKNLIFGSYILSRNTDDLKHLIISNKKDCLLFYNLIYNMNTNCFLKRKKIIFDKIKVIERLKTNKSYKITHTDGEIYYIENGLKNFCNQKNLNYLKFKRLLGGQIKNYDGWSIEKIVENRSNFVFSKYHIKLYEEFTQFEVQNDIEVDTEKELSDKTIDDVLSDDFFDEQDEPESYQDYNDVYHIKNWKFY